MEVTITDTFVKSLKKLVWQQSIPMRIWDTFRYNIPNYFKNLYWFRKELYRFRCWYYTFNIDLFRKSLELTSHNIEKYGIEIDKDRLKKVADMNNAIQILKDFTNNDFTKYAEKELGIKYIHNNGGLFESIKNKKTEKDNYKIIVKSNEIEQIKWKEAWKIVSDNMQGWWD